MTTTYFQTANQLKQEGLLYEAIAYYYKALEQNPKFHWCHHGLGEALTKLGRFEEAISSFQQAIKLNPNGASSYYSMAQILSQHGQIEQANLAYYRAIELNPNWGVVLIKQTGLEQVIACFDYVLKGDPHQAMVYYNFSRYLAEKNLMNEALTCFQKAPQFSHNQEVNKDERENLSETVEIYDILWNNLNQLKKIDDISEPIPTFTNSQVESYFQKNSSYTVIDVNNLTEASQNLLNNHGISVANLKLIKKDDLNLEEIYINSFECEPKIKLSRKVIETVSQLWEPYKNHACSKAMIETDYIYSVCPCSGRIVRSNQSFYVNYYDNWLLMHVYRFVGNEIFYLVIGNKCRGKLCIYLPKKELIIKFSPDWLVDGQILKASINLLKSSLVSNYQKVKFYIQTKIPKKLVFNIGFNENFGHYYWNDLSGILYLQSNDILERVESFLVGDKDFFNIGGVFPEIASHKITKLPNTTDEDLLQTILYNNYFAVQANDLFMSQNLADRVTQFSLKKCSENPDFLEEVERAKKHFPLLCIQIRSSRTWVSQMEGNANIIKKLAEEFPNLGVVFDGWARQEVEDALAESMIAREKDIMNQIIALLPSHFQTYCIIGRTNYEKVIFNNQIDLYSGPIGSGVTTVQWIANKPGVWHGHTYYYEQVWCYGQYSSTGDPLIRENIVPARWVARNYIVDLEDHNYDCDWLAIYEEIVKIIREISPKKA